MLGMLMMMVSSFVDFVFGWVLTKAYEKTCNVKFFQKEKEYVFTILRLSTARFVGYNFVTLKNIKR
jgi:hypothetical protein